jgi:hypothetical protein
MNTIDTPAGTFQVATPALTDEPATGGPRVGPKMEQAVEYVRRHPGTPMQPVSQHVGPHGSNAYGYRTVMRALKAGLIEHRPEHAKRVGQWALFVPEAK